MRPRISALVAEAVRGTFQFSGRSSRSELISYLVFQLAASGLLTLIASFFLERFQLDTATLVVRILLALPMVALIVRRLHDFDRRGSWAIPVCALALYNIGMSIVGLTRGAEAHLAVERVLWPLDWLGIVIVFGTLAIAAMPGTRGENRHGPDPRGTH